MTTKWCFDIDGVITANPQALSWLTYHLCKNENNNYIYLLSWRDGTDATRKIQTISDLQKFNVHYNELIMAPKRFGNIRQAAFWKIAQIHKLGIKIWFDDELKSYKRDYKINVDALLPDVVKIWI